MSEQIKRYMPTVDDRGYPAMEPVDGDFGYVLLADLQAERERVAELEREAVKSADKLHDARNDSHKLEALRQALREKAREWDDFAESEREFADALRKAGETVEPNLSVSECYRMRATELRALENDHA